MTNLLKSQRKENPFVRPGFGDFHPNGCLIQFMKDKCPTKGEIGQMFLLHTTPTKNNRPHSYREHMKKMKYWHL